MRHKTPSNLPPHGELSAELTSTSNFLLSRCATGFKDSTANFTDIGPKLNSKLMVVQYFQTYADREDSVILTIRTVRAGGEMT